MLRGADTRRLDQFAAEGYQLLDYAPEAQCRPTRSALMTGRYAIRSGNHTVPFPGSPGGLVAWERTQGDVFPGPATRRCAWTNGTSATSTGAGRPTMGSTNGTGRMLSSGGDVRECVAVHGCLCPLTAAVVAVTVAVRDTGRPSGARARRRCRHGCRRRYRRAFGFAGRRRPPGSAARAPSPSAPVPGTIPWPARRVVRAPALTIAPPVHPRVGGEDAGLLPASLLQRLPGARKHARGRPVQARVGKAHRGISPSRLIGVVRISLLSARAGSLVPRETP